MKNKSTKVLPRHYACAFMALFAGAVLFQLQVHASALIAAAFGFGITLCVQASGPRRLRPHAIRR